MKRASLILICIIVSSLLFATINPKSYTIGIVETDLEENSIYTRIYSAMKKEYSDEWLEKYAYSPTSFAVSYSSILSSLLPLDNFLIGKANKDEISVLDLESRKVLKLIIKEGKIFAILEE